MSLPKDPVILLSYVNTQLRDKYSSLEEMGKMPEVDIDEINVKLNSINYYYDEKLNQFK